MLLNQVIKVLQRETRDFQQPLVETIIKEYGKKPFLILASCLLSLRAKDSATIHACRALFEKAQTPQRILDLPTATLEKLLFTIGFYKTKAATLKNVCKILRDRFGGSVPDTEEELLSIKGVGRKTANLVLGLAFDKPAICVDIHVHRISNRLGLVKTKTPEETEAALAQVLPKKYWIEWNKLLVMWGQNVCTPLSPRCSTCAIKDMCKRVGVTKSR